METETLNQAAVHAYFELIALNMRSWQPDVAAWLHSDQSAAALGQLLAMVPCSPTVH